jgi:hypothetical protein
MIKECIVDNPADARIGVSRPTIKKFVENKYHIDLNPLTASHLNRAITSGSVKGIFLLPKGPSGKVKLAPKTPSDTAKENTMPASKRLSSKATARKSVARGTARTTPRLKALTTTTKVKRVKPVTTTAKKPSALKKVLVKKLAVATKKSPVPKKSPSTKKKTTARRSAAKKALTGEAKKRASNPKSKSTTAARINPASKVKAKLVSKTAKPASKT